MRNNMKFSTVGPEGARNLLREKQRRNRLAAKELRVQFPQFSSIRLDFAFNDETIAAAGAPVGRAASAGTRVFRLPVSVCQLQWRIRSRGDVDHIAEMARPCRRTHPVQG